MNSFNRPHMICLGVNKNPTPTHYLQNSLSKGIHLRWNYSKDFGFPWYGTYLLRRETQLEQRVCLGHYLDEGQQLHYDHDYHFEKGHIRSSEIIIVKPNANQKNSLYLLSDMTVNYFSHLPMVDIVVDFQFEGKGSVEVIGLFNDQSIESNVVHNSSSTNSHQQYFFQSSGLNRIILKSKTLNKGVFIHVCYTPSLLLPNEAWQVIPDFNYPLSLPVAMNSYPCASKPHSQTEALKLALKRSSGDLDKIKKSFKDFYPLLREMLKKGPGQGSNSTTQIEYKAANPQTGGQNHFGFPIYDLLMIAALDINIARILALAFVDKSALASKSYDYLLLPDYIGDFHLISGADVPHQVVSLSPNEIMERSFISYNQRLITPKSLKPPQNLKAYSLPSISISESVDQASPLLNVAGINWDISPVSSANQAIGFYHVWRKASNESTVRLITDQEPVVVSKSAFKNDSSYPSGWPTEPLYKIDSSLADGTYEYSVSAVDLFGRHSSRSKSQKIVLYNDSPPPSPSGIEAYLIDPKDKWVVKDKAYKKWHNSLTVSQQQNAIGLRVKWNWPDKTHRLVSPDVEYFQVYFHLGLWNSFFGEIKKISKLSNVKTRIHTDLVSSDAQDIFKNSKLMIDQVLYKVISSRSQSGKLVLDIENQDDDSFNKAIIPSQGSEFCLTVDAPNPKFVDYSNATAWGKPLKQNVTCLPTKDSYESFFILSKNKSDTKWIRRASIAEPIIYGQATVTAVRKSNIESKIFSIPRVSLVLRENPEAPVSLVLRENPEAPAFPYPDGKSYKASKPDYHGKSYFSYQWSKSSQLGLRTHVFRSLDVSLFEVDWQRGVLGFPKLDPKKDFPPEWRTNPGLVQQVQTEIEHIYKLLRGNNKKEKTLAKQQAFAHYLGLSNNALRVLATIRGNEEAFVQITTEPYNFKITKHRDELEGNSLGKYFYRACYLDKAHNKSLMSASSPPVIVQNLLSPEIPDFNDLKSGDEELTLYWNASSEPDVEIYRIYHTLMIDESEDIRLMGKPIVEIKAPNSFEVIDLGEYSKLDQVYWVVPVNQFGEEGDIQAPDKIEAIARPEKKWNYKITFSVNRSAGYSEYLVYRFQKDKIFGDLDDAELVDSIEIQELSWTMFDVKPFVKNYFRIEAVDKNLNVSPTSFISGIAVLDVPPEPPEWIKADWVQKLGEEPWIELFWKTDQANLKCMVQRRGEFEPDWVTLSDWIGDGDQQFYYNDLSVDSEKFYEYRIVALNSSGIKNSWFETKVVEALDNSII